MELDSLEIGAPELMYEVPDYERVTRAGCSVRYYNYSSIPLMLGFRDGMKMKVNSEVGFQSLNKLIAIKEITVQGDCRTNLANVVCKTNKVQDYKNTADCSIDVLLDERPNGTIVFQLKYTIDLEPFLWSDTTVYINELDILLSNLEFDRMPGHPYSTMDNLQEHMKAFDNRGMAPLFLLFANESVCRNGPFYTNVLGSAIQLPVKKIIGLPDGIYFTAGGRPAYILIKDQLKRVYGLMQVGANMRSIPGVYTDPEEALRCGSFETIKEQQLKIEQTTRDAELKAVEYQTKLAEHNMKLKEISLKREERMQSHELTKAEHELALRSAKRKDTSEVIKFAPSIFSGVSSVLPLLF